MQRTISVLLLLFVTVALCSFDTAAAQTITVGQSRITLYAAPGGVSQVESLRISANSTPLEYHIAAQSGGDWLSIGAYTGRLPETILVSANSASLQSGTYYGTITISAEDNANVAPVMVQVVLYVGSTASSAVTVTPPQLAFDGQAYSTPPAAKYLAIKGVSNNVSFSVSTATSDGYPWLQATPLSGTTPANIAITANPGSLPAGEYNGTVTVTPLQGTSVTLPVSFLVAGSNVVKSSPSALHFYYQTGKSNPDGQRLDFLAVNSPASVTLKTTTASGGNWLKVTPSTFTTPYSTYVTVSPASLPVGEYEGNIAVMAQGDSTPVFNVPVKLTIGNGALLTVSGSLSPFNYEQGEAAPAGQVLSVGSSSTPVDFQVTTSTSDSHDWLMVGPLSGTTPATLNVGVNTDGLEPGTYSGTITISSSEAVNAAQTVQVTLNVTGEVAVNVSPGSLYFGYQINGSNPPPMQTVSVTSPGSSVSFWVSSSISDCNVGWLQVSQPSATTPADIGVSVNTTFLTNPQICNGALTISGPDVATPTRVPAMLLVSNQPLLNIAPQAIRITAQYGGMATGQTGLSLSTTNNSSIPFTAVASTTNGGTQWLTVSSSSGSAPATLTVGLKTTSLSPGTYSGAIAIYSPGLPTPMSIPVVLTITPIASVAASPNSLRFTQVQGGANPAAQQVDIVTDGNAVAYTASATTTVGSGWLSVTSSGGTTPGKVTVTAKAAAGMAAGTYTGYVVITSAGAKNSPYRIPVTFVLSAPAATISPAPATLSFTYQRGATAKPEGQTIRITASGSAAINLTASASVQTGSNWLSVTPASGTTPADLTASVDPSGLEAGAYTGTITVTPAAGAATPITILVTLEVSAGPTPAVAGIANAASGKTGGVAPGEIVIIGGQRLGPADGVGYHIGESGKLDTRSQRRPCDVRRRCSAASVRLGDTDQRDRAV